MANYLTYGAKFTPFSFERYLQPYQIYAQAYKEAEAAYDAQMDKITAIGSYLNQARDGEEYNKYKQYMEMLENASNSLATSGLSPTDVTKLRGLKTDFNKNIAPIAVGIEAKKAAQAEYDKIIAGKNTMYSSLNPYEMGVGEFMGGDNPMKDNIYLDSSEFENRATMDAGNYSKSQLRVVPADVLGDPNYDEWYEVSGFTPDEIDSYGYGNNDAIDSIVDDLMQSPDIQKMPENVRGKIQKRLVEAVKNGMLGNTEFKYRRKEQVTSSELTKPNGEQRSQDQVGPNTPQRVAPEQLAEEEEKIFSKLYTVPRIVVDENGNETKEDMVAINGVADYSSATSDEIQTVNDYYKVKQQLIDKYGELKIVTYPSLNSAYSRDNQIYFGNTSLAQIRKTDPDLVAEYSRLGSKYASISRPTKDALEAYNTLNNYEHDFSYRKGNRDIQWHKDNFNFRKNTNIMSTTYKRLSTKDLNEAGKQPFVRDALKAALSSVIVATDASNKSAVSLGEPATHMFKVVGNKKVYISRKDAQEQLSGSKIDKATLIFNSHYGLGAQLDNGEIYYFAGIESTGLINNTQALMSNLSAVNTIYDKEGIDKLISTWGTNTMLPENNGVCKVGALLTSQGYANVPEEIAKHGVSIGETDEGELKMYYECTPDGDIVQHYCVVKPSQEDDDRYILDEIDFSSFKDEVAGGRRRQRIISVMGESVLDAIINNHERIKLNNEIYKAAAKKSAKSSK